MVVQSIPIVDFAKFEENPNKAAQQVFDACKSIGFFYIINHNIPQRDIDKAFELSKEFFNLPQEERHKYLIGKDNHGYSELYSERLDPEHQKQGDHKEGFNFRNFINGEPFAPLPSVFDKEKDFLCYFSQMCYKTALQILLAFGIALEIPEDKGGKDFFVKAHSYENSGDILRFLKYPRGGETDVKDPVRAGAHSDYGSITLLFQKDIPGLEVQASRTEWISAPLIEGAILVNVGDQMELWTNGLFKSTLHRVVFLPEHKHLDRYSMPFFVHPDDNIPLSPVPSKHVDQSSKTDGHILTAGEHLRNRLDATYTYGKK
ncbi:hypothetical protein G6F70_004754 [Rhizopus microsporus]|uniref:Fe2OG dioxygenase domain-containing protein n=1 Tax=Rhizopus azygosporus TaxID=86630 RepID=A0A367JGK6_RHIAZ|nr:hypothetical protein G6F71_003494 [Rhizopus microsporus]RCH88851.1 hypothetical protein CU097_004647 [Rhizopus azygosporus]KAG1199642.1 hypothetical protein G6F70_004754 [Rhizopus microsporus]KAG1206946.1 hypothetical protein G6F69_008445 [Rhizopus microsporus]KAG1227547.1 hypothetical protein G6F67_008386 [Rhizopus microsporus]